MGSGGLLMAVFSPAAVINSCPNVNEAMLLREIMLEVDARHCV